MLTLLPQRLTRAWRGPSACLFGAFGLGAGLLLFPSLPGAAQGQGQGLRLELGSTSLSFPSANPDQAPSVPAGQNPISISTRYAGNPNRDWVVLLTAHGDLTSGADTIPISRITWTASGGVFRSGTLSKSDPQVLASGTGRERRETGMLRFFLQNSWFYQPGTYSQSLTFTAVTF